LNFTLENEDAANRAQSSNQGYYSMTRHWAPHFWNELKHLFEAKFTQLKDEFHQAFIRQANEALPLCKNHFERIQKGRVKRDVPHKRSAQDEKTKALAVESFTKMLIQNNLATEVFTAEEVLNIVKTYRSTRKLIRAIGSWSNTHPKGNQLLDLEAVEEAMKIAGIKRVLDV